LAAGSPQPAHDRAIFETGKRETAL
jgi:hypothetical protein